MSVWLWLLHATGADNTSGVQYGFWSGFGSDLGEFALIGGIAAVYRKHNCHVKGCWRIGKHPVVGTPYIVCKRHHPSTPSGPITPSHIYDAHRRARKHNTQGGA